MSEVQSSAWAECPPACRAARYTKTVPRKASAIPTEQMTMYFHEASSEPRVRRNPTKNAVTMVVASTATHSTPTLAASTARSMKPTKAWTSTP